VHGVRYAYPLQRGAMTRGVPTAYAAPPLSEHIVMSAADAVPVWPDPEGQVRGEAWSPLYPKAAEELTRRLS
jgi:hypothetical protein